MGNIFRPRVVDNNNFASVHTARKVSDLPPVLGPQQLRRHSLRISYTGPPAETSRSKLRLNYSNNERELMHQFLFDFECDKPCSKLDLIVVRDHWQRLHMTGANTSITNSLKSFHGHFQHPHPVPQLHDHDQDPPILRLLEVYRFFLLSLSPETNGLFHGLPRVQERMLDAMIGGMANLVEDEHAQESAGRIALRLFQYGVTCDQLNAFGGALLRTLKSLAPNLFTKHTELAWRAVICQVAVLLLTQLDWLYRQAQMTLRN